MAIGRAKFMAGRSPHILSTVAARRVADTLATLEREFTQTKTAGGDLNTVASDVRRLNDTLYRAGYDRRGMLRAQHWTERVGRWIHVRA